MYLKQLDKNMKNEVDDFLAGLNNEPKDDPFVQDATDPFAVETKEEKKEEPKEEKSLPFNKDPKVQKFIEKEISKRLAEVKPERTEPQTFKETVTDDEATAVLTRVIGNDTPERVQAIKDFKKVLDGLEEKGAQKALQQIQKKADEEQAEVNKNQERLVEGFENIEEEHGVDLLSSKGQNLRTEFINFITKIAPKDSEGNVTEYPDIEESFKLFKDMKKPEPNTRAKELASRSIGRSNDASIVKKTGNSWKDVDKLFSKLST